MVRVKIVAAWMAIIVVSVAAVMDQDHTSSSNDLSNQDYRCWSKDYIDVVEVWMAVQVAWWNTLHETPLDAYVDLHLQHHDTLAANGLVQTLAHN